MLKTLRWPQLQRKNALNRSEAPFFPPKGYKQHNKISNTHYSGGTGYRFVTRRSRTNVSKCDVDPLNFCWTHHSVSVRNTSKDWVFVLVRLWQGHANMLAYLKRKLRAQIMQVWFCCCLDPSLVPAASWSFGDSPPNSEKPTDKVQGIKGKRLENKQQNDECSSGQHLHPKRRLRGSVTSEGGHSCQTGTIST